MPIPSNNPRSHAPWPESKEIALGALRSVGDHAAFQDLQGAGAFGMIKELMLPSLKSEALGKGEPKLAECFGQTCDHLVESVYELRELIRKGINRDPEFTVQGAENFFSKLVGASYKMSKILKVIGDPDKGYSSDLQELANSFLPSSEGIYTLSVSQSVFLLDNRLERLPSAPSIATVRATELLKQTKDVLAAKYPRNKIDLQISNEAKGKEVIVDPFWFFRGVAECIANSNRNATNPEITLSVSFENGFRRNFESNGTSYLITAQMMKFEIQDNGGGAVTPEGQKLLEEIDPETGRQRIFSFGESTRKGGGLGLAVFSHVATILRGWIEAKNAVAPDGRPGFSVILYLPKKPENRIEGTLPPLTSL